MDDRLENLLRHIDHVRTDCIFLGEKLIERGEEEFGRRLIANGHVHDASKFFGIEFEMLNDGAFPYRAESPEKEKLFKLAIRQHVLSNPHHAEFWPGGIKEMPRLYIAEMVVDWKARSNEQGQNLMEWIKEKATERYEFSTSHAVFKEIKSFVDLLLERKFS